MSLQPITILRRARKLIEKPENWTRYAFMRRCKDQICYCMSGALTAAAGYDVKPYCTKPRALENTGARLRAYAALGTVVGRSNITIFNDNPTTTHADVLKAFDDAVALIKSESKK